MKARLEVAQLQSQTLAYLKSKAKKEFANYDAPTRISSERVMQDGAESGLRIEERAMTSFAATTLVVQFFHSTPVVRLTDSVVESFCPQNRSQHPSQVSAEYEFFC